MLVGGTYQDVFGGWHLSECSFVEPTGDTHGWLMPSLREVGVWHLSGWFLWGSLDAPIC